MKGFLVGKALIIILQTIFMMAWLSNHHPYAPIKLNYEKIFSEFVVVIICDLLLCCADPLIEPSSRN